MPKHDRNCGCRNSEVLRKRCSSTGAADIRGRKHVMSTNPGDFRASKDQGKKIIKQTHSRRKYGARCEETNAGSSPTFKTVWSAKDNKSFSEQRYVHVGKKDVGRGLHNK